MVTIIDFLQTAVQVNREQLIEQWGFAPILPLSEHFIVYDNKVFIEKVLNQAFAARIEGEPSFCSDLDVMQNHLWDDYKLRLDLSDEQIRADIENRRVRVQNKFRADDLYLLNLLKKTPYEY